MCWPVLEDRNKAHLVIGHVLVGVHAGPPAPLALGRHHAHLGAICDLQGVTRCRLVPGSAVQNFPVTQITWEHMWWENDHFVGVIDIATFNSMFSLHVRRSAATVMASSKVKQPVTCVRSCWPAKLGFSAAWRPIMLQSNVDV